jgi:hypothetical protein
VSSISNDNSSYTGILVWDGGVLKYRTKSEIRSDIGAGSGSGSVTSVTVQGTTGLSGSGTVTTSGTITLTNSDRGSSQAIYKNIATQSGTATANSNNDTLTITGTGGTTTSRSGDTITINSTDNNDNHYVTSLSFNTSNGVLTAARNGLSSITVDLDGRYLQLSGGTMTGSVRLNDNVQLQIGSSNDAYITHNGTDTYFVNGVGNLEITNDTNGGDIVFKSDDGSGGTTEYVRLDGGIKRTIFSQNAGFEDNIKAIFGSSNDLQIYHNGSNSFIDEAGTGDLYVRASDNMYF